MFQWEVEDIPIPLPLSAADGPICDIEGDDSLQKLSKQNHHLELRQFTKSELDLRDSMKDGFISQENDPKTANNKKFLDYLANAEATSPPKTAAN